MESQNLAGKAQWVWRETLRLNQRAPETRVASSLSPIEIFVALYYGGVVRFDAKNPLSIGETAALSAKVTVRYACIQSSLILVFSQLKN